MSNYPSSTGPNDPEAPWNQPSQSNREDIEDQIEELQSLMEATIQFSAELETSDYLDLFSAKALLGYDCSNPVDMLEAMVHILRDRIEELKK